jgi:hypothetical protein
VIFGEQGTGIWVLLRMSRAVFYRSSRVLYEACAVAMHFTKQ